ncbi:response regulator transcription factor [Fundicoccus ignavus]|uniref:Heme response regulator HssR n=1 Tax=Fundicoccus ignavus TaxID=2664442 RepID=A0A6I2GJZ6_9LACT|nr:response regulator transcription factor [Fundicoccus ignavus]MRI82195.1 response regulator [Fundicoccus ignavus]MRI85559.1 response regulator [Fundicoccus ignavus]MRJ47357.1 response regulator [Fundicoccus ignavus]
MNKILVIEDNENLARIYQSILSKNYFDVFITSDGQQALDLLEKIHVDLIITDVMMPNMDGFEFASLMRDAGFEVPILMITALDSLEDKKRGFKLGIDDYMVKPIDLDEMVLRVEALLRRAKIAHTKQLTVNETILDQSSYNVMFNNQQLTLPQKEFQLLYKLLSYPDKIFTRQQLMDEIWGLDTDTDERTIDVHIKRLRDRFSDNRDFEIVTVRGLGYKAVIE